MWDWPHEDYSLTCRYGSKLDAPKQEPLAIYSLLLNTNQQLRSPGSCIRYHLCVCVCPCWCVLGRQGICIISPNDKRPQTTLVYIGNLLVQGTSMIGQCFSKVFKLLWVDGWPNKHIDSNSGLVQNVCSPHVQAAGIRITAVPVIFLKTNLWAIYVLDSTMSIFVHACICNICLPVVPHKAVAEVSE